MPTTTIRIDDELKERVALVAERAGKTPHAFMVDAIALATEEAERSQEFQHVASERWAKYLVSGESIPWSEARAYLEARLRGKTLPRPKARKSR